jgi:tRNA (cmo5U34)-methyltransferase
LGIRFYMSLPAGLTGIMGDMKSTVEQIRQRFDQDVERFSSLETGQSSTVDAPLVLDLLPRTAAAATPGAQRALDIGCGAGNFSLKLLQFLPDLELTLVDLSRPMLDRALTRLDPVAHGAITCQQGDIRTIRLGEARFDIIMAGAVFHHLRSEDEWHNVFARCFTALRPGGGLWIADLVDHGLEPVRALMMAGYRDYLTALNGPEYCERVLAYVEQEDTPRPLLEQVDLLREVGFGTVEILHKHNCFAAFGAIKPLQP